MSNETAVSRNDVLDMLLMLKVDLELIQKRQKEIQIDQDKIKERILQLSAMMEQQAA